MRIVRFNAEHLKSIDIQPAQREYSDEFKKDEYIKSIESNPYSFSGIHNGEVIFCAGVQELWENRAIGWAILSTSAPKHLKAIHRATKGFLDQAKWRRVEALIENDFKEGHRWARLLGFELEGVMKHYSPEGKDFAIYART